MGCVPVVGCADTDGVNVLSCQHLAKIAIIGACYIIIGLVDANSLTLAAGFHRIANSDNAGILLGEKCLAVVSVYITRADKA